LTPSLSRLTRWKGRGRLGVLLAFVYLWAFAALGLTHTHRTAEVALCPGNGAAAVAASPGLSLFSPVPHAAESTSCLLCDTANATTAALVSPTLAATPPAAEMTVPVSPILFASSRSLASAQPRAPPLF
jgi:Protein of unknown function (DUF2946)